MPRMLRLRRGVRLVLLAGLIPLVMSCGVGPGERYSLTAVGEIVVCRLDQESGEVVCAFARPEEHETFDQRRMVIPAGPLLN